MPEPRNLGDYFEKVIHTDRSEIAALPDHTLAEVILKCMSLQETSKMYFSSRDLMPTIETSFGRYVFIFDTADCADLVVMEVH